MDSLGRRSLGRLVVCLGFFVLNETALAHDTPDEVEITHDVGYALYFDKDLSVLYGEDLITVKGRIIRPTLVPKNGPCPTLKQHVCLLASGEFCSKIPCADLVSPSDQPPSTPMPCDPYDYSCDVMSVGRDAAYCEYYNDEGQVLFAEGLRRIRGRFVQGFTVPNIGDDDACTPPKPFNCCQGLSCQCSPFPCR
jgi:hypothetical protein